MSRRKVFSTDDDEILIGAVKRFPAIYVARHKDYKCMQVKENMWKLIAEIVGERKSAADCKRRWRDIKDNYYKIRRKKLSTGSGSSTRPPKWPLYELLSFLDSTHKEKTSHGTTSDEETSSERRPIKGEEDSDTVISGLTSPTSEHLDDSATCTKRKHSTEITPTVGGKRPSTPTTCFSNTSTLAKVIEAFESRSSQCLERLSGVTKNEDDVDAFFRSIALSVKKLPPHLIAKAKLNVLSAVTELEIASSSSTTNS